MKNDLKQVVQSLQRRGRSRNQPVEKLVAASQTAYLQESCRILKESARNADEKRLLKFGYRVYSQSDEDGILHEIFRRIAERSRTFIEIGSGDGLENNTLFLLLQGWRGIWIEASQEKVDLAKKNVAPLFPEAHLDIQKHLVNRDNADALISRLSPDPDVDLLSVDIDGNDYYVLDAIRHLSPRVIVIEYNAKFPPDFNWVMEYNEHYQWDGSDYFGASLKALETLLTEKGYSLVGCNLLGCNAFFVRDDAVSESKFCSPYTAENHYEPARYFLLPAYHASFPPSLGRFATEKDRERHQQ